MLAAVSVFVLLALVVAQLLQNTVTVAGTSKARVGADAEARKFLDRFGQDISRMIKRNDVDFFVNRQAGVRDGTYNDQIFFYSEVPGIVQKDTGDTENLPQVSLVGYRVEGVSTSGKKGLQLQRYGVLRKWNATDEYTAIPFLTYKRNGNPDWQPIRETTLEANEEVTSPNSTSSDFRAISESIFRVEIFFLLRDGTFSVDPVLNEAPPDWTGNTGDFLQVNAAPPTADTLVDSEVGARWYDTETQRAYIKTGNWREGGIKKAIWKSLGWRDVQAIVVCIAVLDEKYRKIVEDREGNPLASAAQALEKADNTRLRKPKPSLPEQEWRTVVDSGTVGGLPAGVAANIRIYQRIFYLNTP